MLYKQVGKQSDDPERIRRRVQGHVQHTGSQKTSGEGVNERPVLLLVPAELSVIPCGRLGSSTAWKCSSYWIGATFKRYYRRQEHWFCWVTGHVYDAQMLYSNQDLSVFTLCCPLLCLFCLVCACLDNIRVDSCGQCTNRWRRCEKFKIRSQHSNFMELTSKLLCVYDFWYEVFIVFLLLSFVSDRFEYTCLSELLDCMACCMYRYRLEVHVGGRHHKDCEHVHRLESQLLLLLLILNIWTGTPVLIFRQLQTRKWLNSLVNRGTICLTLSLGEDQSHWSLVAVTKLQRLALITTRDRSQELNWGRWSQYDEHGFRL